MDKKNLPSYRLQLKSRIHAAGYRTSQEFARAANVDAAEVSRTLNGILLPKLEKQEKMAAALGLTLDGFGQLL